MEIIWFGHSCFRLSDRTAVVVTDPFDESLGYTVPRVQADIVTISHDHPHHSHLAAVEGDYRVLDSPTESEIKSVFVTGIASYPNRKEGDEPVSESDCNVVFVFEFDGIAVCHLGDLAQVPSQAQVQALNDVDVLLVPVGGGGDSLSASRAVEVVSLIEPRIVVPMHYGFEGGDQGNGPVRKFLKEMGVGQVVPADDLKISRTNLPQETQVVLLNPAGLRVG